MKYEETIIVSLGGSMVVPDGVNVSFLKAFSGLIQQHVGEGKRFCIIVGGGKPARQYQQALKELKTVTADELDWVGIAATHFNASLVRLAFGENAQDTIITDPTDVTDTGKPIFVAGGWKPGWSTDYVAVTLAKKLNAQKVINLSNIAHVYSADPRTNPDAEKFENLSWSEYRNLIPSEWTPGMSAPFDPMASKLADEQAIEVAVLDGANLENLDAYLREGSFEGTVIK